MAESERNFPVYTSVDTSRRKRLLFTVLFFGTLALLLGFAGYMWWAEDRVIGHIARRDPLLATLGVYVLAKKGVPPRAEPVLLEALERGDDLLRAAAARALGTTRKEVYLVHLGEVAREDPKPRVRAAALEGLELLGEGGGARYAHAALLEEQDPDVLVAAVSALGAFRQHQYVPEMIRLVEHKDSKVARAAVEALENFTAPGESYGHSVDAWNRWYSDTPR